LRDAGDVAAGYIGMGDRYGNKNGGIQAFLLEAVNNGAKIVENCRVDRVITDTATKQRRATGVQCQVGARKLTVKARKAVILAAGALQTPCLLQKSGFQNKHIGKHLRLHPTTGVIGFFPADNPIDAILGAPMTTACNEFARGPADDGYGVKIECPCAYPGLLAAATPWTSAQIFRDRMLRYRNMVPLVLVQRDSGDGGHVKAARDGVGITIDYTVSKQDKKSQMKAMRGAAQILVASGSTEVATGHIRDVGFKTGGKKVDDASLHEYLDAIDSRGMKDHEIGLFSAHQMGSCRMSTSPLAGVVDPNGEAWECDDLFIMDASVFPTASGSNPMVTVLTITYMLSSRLCSSLKLRDNPDGNNLSSGFSADDRAKAVELSREREMMRSHEDATLLASLGNVAVILPLLLAFVLGWLFGRF
jgi:choline dehydrogenase-like flavoprotein